MNALYEALKYHLWNDGDVADLISDRVYPAGETPSNARLPFIVYSKPSSNQVRHQGGSSGLAQTVIRLNCWGLTARSAAEVRDAAFASLDEFTGSFGDPSDPLDVRLIVFEDEASDTDAPVDNTETGRFLETLDATVWHEVPVTPASS